MQKDRSDEELEIRIHRNKYKMKCGLECAGHLRKWSEMVRDGPVPGPGRDPFEIVQVHASGCL